MATSRQAPGTAKPASKPSRVVVSGEVRPTSQNTFAFPPVSMGLVIVDFVLAAFVLQGSGVGNAQQLDQAAFVYELQASASISCQLQIRGAYGMRGRKVYPDAAPILRVQELVGALDAGLGDGDVDVLVQPRKLLRMPEQPQQTAASTSQSKRIKASEAERLGQIVSGCARTETADELWSG